jgi:CheY-like chemotaxis protein/anti-sigma regulatory factor (Ser/Thr protein kinase)
VFDGPAMMPMRVHTDEHRLRQILINLLSNAIKFTAEGEVTLRVRWRTEIAEFDVIDTGIGIAPGDLDRIFEPLQRVKSTQQSLPGMGLGLTIARVLTEIMGGEISVTSEPGIGSRFRVRLMLSQAVGHAVSQIAAKQITGYLGPRRTVVVADDDQNHRALLTALLTPLGFTVLAAEDGAACLEIAAGRTPDLFLIDLSMPGMNGWALARELRELHPVAPIIIISADGRELKHPPSHASHHDDTLTKPISMTGLLERIARLLQLDWVTPGAEPEPARDAVAPLTEAQIEKLREIAAIGYVSGLRTQLDVFERETPAASAHFVHLRALLAEYRLDAFVSSLEGAAKGLPLASEAG